MFEQPTAKQIAFIADMEKAIGEQFTGSSKEDASRWISEHKEEFEDAKWANNHGAFIPRIF